MAARIDWGSVAAYTVILLMVSLMSWGFASQYHENQALDREKALAQQALDQAYARNTMIRGCYTDYKADPLLGAACVDNLGD